MMLRCASRASRFICPADWWNETRSSTAETPKITYASGNDDVAVGGPEVHRPGGLVEGDEVEHRRDSQDHVCERERRRRRRVQQLVDSLSQREGGAGHEHPERGQQRPEIRLPAVSERVLIIARAVGA